jgi:cell division protein FtsA
VSDVKCFIMSQLFITALDIGSQNIKAAVSELRRDGQLSLLRIVKMPSHGVRKGVVDDLADVTRSVNEVLGEIKKFEKGALRNIFLSIGGSDVKMNSAKGIVAVSRADSEIQRDDIERVIEASQAVKLKNNRVILHAIIQEYVVDDVGDIRDPLGMVGNRLEANSLIIDAFEPNVKSLTRSVEAAGGGIEGLIFGPLAAARSVLTKNQKELGVALVDIGFGKTGLAVYEDNHLIHSKVFPFGSGNITNDLAIGLQIPIHAAENIKLSLGLAIAKESPSREMVELKKFDAGAKKAVSRRGIAEIVEDRLAEIFHFVDNELKTVGKSGKLPAGVVLTGGGSKLPLMVDLAKRELKLSAQIGIPDLSKIDMINSELAIESEDPEFSCVFGLLQSGHDQMLGEETGYPIKGGLFKRFFKNFIP